MIYLVISIIFMILLALLMRIGMDRGAHALGMSLVFRIVAGILIILWTMFRVDWNDLLLWREALPYGLIGAFFFWCSGYTTLRAVQIGHLGITYTMLRMSMLIPTLASIFYWHEIILIPPTLMAVLRLTGVAAAVAGILLMSWERMHTSKKKPSYPQAHTHPREWFFWLIAMFLSQGCWELVLRSSRSIEHPQGREFFIMLVFGISMVASIAMIGIFRPRIRRTEIGYGTLAGICSLIASGTRPWALKYLDGIIVFPVTTTTTMFVVVALGALIWRERLGKLGGLGILTAIAATLLLTVGK